MQAGMQVCNYSSMQVCNYATMQLYKCASVKACKNSKVWQLIKKIGNNMSIVHSGKLADTQRMQVYENTSMKVSQYDFPRAWLKTTQKQQISTSISPETRNKP